MPTSNWQNISYNIELVRKLNPYSILDVGIGFGRWGILFREFLEIWNDNNYEGKWKRTIDGIEIFKDYIKDYHRYFYNNIYIEDALTHIREMKSKYDLINFGDVIEHFTKENGKELIDSSLKKAKYVLINIPLGKGWEQEGTKENPHERHLSTWTKNDFLKYPHRLIKIFKDDTLRNFGVILLSSQPVKFENRYGKYFFAKNVLKNRLGLRKTVERIEKRKK